MHRLTMARSPSLKTEFLKKLLAVSRWRLLTPVIQFLFIHMNHLLPVDRLDENENWMAFNHPQPEYPLHLLILPKMGIMKLSDALDQQPVLFASLFDLIKALIDRFDLDTVGYRLITNGGPYQSIPQWHWHLISENWEGKDG